MADGVQRRNPSKQTKFHTEKRVSDSIFPHHGQDHWSDVRSSKKEGGGKTASQRKPGVEAVDSPVKLYHQRECIMHPYALRTQVDTGRANQVRRQDSLCVPVHKRKMWQDGAGPSSGTKAAATVRHRAAWDSKPMVGTGNR